MPEFRQPLALFDLDDTLCDYSTARRTRLEIAFSLAGGLDSETVSRMIEQSVAEHPHGAAHFPELMAAHGAEDPEAAATVAAAWFRANRFYGLRFFPDTRRVMQDLRAAGHPIGVITNGPADIQREKVTLLGVDDLVDFAVISGEFGSEKPDPAIFAAALEQGSRTAAEAIFVGDALEFDIAGANAAGIRSVWMNRAGKRLKPGDPNPDHEVSSLDEVAEILRGWPRT